MNNFIVGVTNNPPDIMSPRTHGYLLCGQYPGEVPRQGSTLFVQCSSQTPPARYVVIMAAEYMNICELEVYEAGKLCCKTSNMKRHEPGASTASDGLIETQPGNFDLTKNSA